MVSLPSLPTDNLYKFMAVTGLVLFLTSQVAPFLANRTKIDRFRAKADTLIEFVTDANQRVHTLNNEFSQTRLNTEKWTEAALAEDKFRLGNLSRATSAITGIGEAKVKLLGLSLQATEVETTTQFAVLRWVGIVGFVIALSGFGLWWFKIQRHQDRILVCEYEKHKRDAANNTADAHPIRRVRAATRNASTAP